MIKIQAAKAKFRDPEDLIRIVMNNKHTDCDSKSARRLLAHLLNQGGNIKDIDATDGALTFLCECTPHVYTIKVGDGKGSVRRVN